MLTLNDVHHLPSPMPLHQTPAWLRLLGYPRWRYRSDQLRTAGKWIYITQEQYAWLFGKA